MRDTSVDELVALARGMRDATSRVEANGPVLDTTGTGGDGFKTINFSTLAALLAAAAGVQVAKQNRPAISSLCGSTEFLAELGVAYDLPPEAAAACLREVGICFLYAPQYHPDVVNDGSGAGRTLPDLMTPIANPAGANYYLVGVADADLAA